MIDEMISDVIAAASRVVVVQGSTFDSAHRASQQVLADVRDPAALAELQIALRASTTDFAPMEPGDPTIVILDDRAVLLAIQCVQPDFIRLSELTNGDAQLVDPAALQLWLAQRVAHA